jgi:hypothetical protein
MFWNLVTSRYENYSQIKHLIMFVILALYSLIGGVCFCALEANTELEEMEKASDTANIRRIAARNQLVYDLQYFFNQEVNVTRLLHKKFGETLDIYDRMMGYELGPSQQHNRKWTIWGGLYYAGSIYTTIGYGDIVVKTIAGRIFTVIYALFGIPLVITVLNVWGGGLFQLIELLWQKCLVKGARRLKRTFSTSRRQKRIASSAEDYAQFSSLPTRSPTTSQKWQKMRSCDCL